MNCHCGLSESYENCCEPYILGKKNPESAESLMRSRYSAFVVHNIEYLKNSTALKTRNEFNASTTESWAKNSKWKGLKILKTEKGTKDDRVGVVEFIATYELDNRAIDHHEVSQFEKDINGKWFFVDGDSHTHKHGEHHHHHQPSTPIVRTNPKIGRNDPCFCGSGKKYKKCCG